MTRRDEEWETAKTKLALGARVRATVDQHAPFGMFVTISGVPFKGLVQITDFKDAGVMTVDQYPAVGSEIQAVVLGFKDAGMQIWHEAEPARRNCKPRERKILRH